MIAIGFGISVIGLCITAYGKTVGSILEVRIGWALTVIGWVIIEAIIVMQA